MITRVRRFTESQPFHVFVIAAIVANAILLGIETNSSLMAEWGHMLQVGNYVFKIVFAVEIVLRLIAHHPRYRDFFRDGWNVFDFVIVLVTTLPLGGEFANVSRLLRLLRVVRLVSISSELRLIVGTMFRSIPSMGHVILLLSMLLYVYAIAGYHLFSAVDPDNWGSLPKALLSLFQVVTLEGWAEFQANVLPAKPMAWIYFASFIIIGVFVVINLFIAVVINNLEKVHAEEIARADATHPQRELLERIARIKNDLDTLESHIRKP